MIALIEGKLLEKSKDSVVVSAGGVGYLISVPMSTLENLPDTGEIVSLRTYLHVREDSMQLYAFSSGEERMIFTALIGVAGVGPKLAQTILSGMPARDLIRAIQDADLYALVSISGVGRKTAQRLVVELKEKLSQLGLLEKGSEDLQMPFQPSKMEEEAILALLSLGYKRPAIEKALSQVRQNGNPESLEDLVKDVLRII